MRSVVGVLVEIYCGNRLCVNRYPIGEVEGTRARLKCPRCREFTHWRSE